MHTWAKGYLGNNDHISPCNECASFENENVINYNTAVAVIVIKSTMDYQKKCNLSKSDLIFFRLHRCIINQCI